MNTKILLCLALLSISQMAIGLPSVWNSIKMDFDWLEYLLGDSSEEDCDKNEASIIYNIFYDSNHDIPTKTPKKVGLETNKEENTLEIPSNKKVISELDPTTEKAKATAPVDKQRTKTTIAKENESTNGDGIPANKQVNSESDQTIEKTKATAPVDEQKTKTTTSKENESTNSNGIPANKQKNSESDQSIEKTKATAPVDEKITPKPTATVDEATPSSETITALQP